MANRLICSKTHWKQAAKVPQFAILTGWLLLHLLATGQSRASSQGALPAAWMTQMAALSGQAPKLNTRPLVQLDTSTKYYKTMIDGMVQNFKLAVGKANEKSFSLNNSTSSRPINLIYANQQQTQQQRVSIQDLQIDGLTNPKVTNVYVNSKNMKLHVVFNYKLIKIYGKCYSTGSGSQQLAGNSKKAAQSQANSKSQLLDATNWNTSWSANLMPMIGKEHFDLSKVYTMHSQQRLSLNLKECPQAAHEKLKSALVERIKGQIEARLVEVMESVMMQTDVPNEDFVSTTSTTESSLAMLAANSKPKERGKRASPALAKPKADFKTASAAKPAASAGASKKPVAGQEAKRKPAKSANVSKKSDPIGTKKVPANTTPVAKRQTAANSTGAKRQPAAVIASKKANDSKPAKPKSAPAKKSQQQTQAPRQSQKALKRTKRQTPCQQGEELDDYVDQLFRFGTRIVRAMEPITTPNATIELPDYNLKIFLYDGKGTRAYKFRRAKSAWVFCSNETISLGLTIEVEELRVAYKYRVISGNRLLFDGDLEAKLSPKVQAQFSQKVQEEDSEEPVQQRVDRVRVFRLGKVHVIIRGLGNLTQSLSMIINSYLNDNQEELQPTFRMVEGDAVRLINRMLANVNVPLLSVV